MNTFLTKTIILIITLVYVCSNAYSQGDTGQFSVNLSLPEITLVDVEPDISNSIYFTISTATKGGDSPAIENTTNETLWINYTSALPSGQNSRTINAEISQGSLPLGITLYLEAAAYSGTGDGNLGSADGKIQLSNQPQPIISGIGNCYTGDGVGNGHQLTFSIEISDYSEVYAVENAYYVVLYTITDN